MNAQTTPVSNQMSVVATLAALLERVDRSGLTPDAHQYQVLVQRLNEELPSVEGDPTLQALLLTHPSAAQVYENLHYQHAGLCRSDLDAAMTAEIEVRHLLARAAAKGHA